MVTIMTSNDQWILSSETSMLSLLLSKVHKYSELENLCTKHTRPLTDGSELLSIPFLLLYYDCFVYITPVIIRFQTIGTSLINLW